MRGRRLGVAVVVVLLLAMPVAAHVPSFPHDNTSPDQAVEVPDAVKSWSFYDRLDRGQAKYYRFTLQAGERLRVGTFTPNRGAFTPSIVVMSPHLDDTGDVPSWVTVPEGMGAIVVHGDRPSAAEYEPFAPSADYHTASIDRQVTRETTFLVAVYEPENRTGPTGVTIGYEESFSLEEYLTVPFDLVRTYRWAGQHPLAIASPYLVVGLLGAIVAFRRRRRSSPRFVRLALVGGALLLLGTAASTLTQTVRSVSQTGLTPGVTVTALYIVLPAIGGLWVLHRATTPGFRLSNRTRLGLAAVGLVALVTWAGFLVGPLLLLAVAALPPRFLPRES